MCFKIALLGDISYNGLICSQPHLNEDRYSEIAPILSVMDLVIANFESPIRSGPYVNEFKSVHYSTEMSVARALLKNHNIGCVSLANNHIFDYKIDGLRATIQVLDELNISHTGAGWNPSHIEPVLITIGQHKVGFIAYVDVSTNPETEPFEDLYINYLEIEKIKHDISQIRDKVDILICSLHWGEDYSFYPTKQQVEIANDLISSQVDIIMGHHPHTMQPFEKKGDAHIFYSLGGLTYGDDYIEGRLRALKVKTKQAFIPVFSGLKSPPQFIAIRELPGNKIIIEDRDAELWADRKWKITKLQHRYKIVSLWISFEEKVLNRIYEFLWGYYRRGFYEIMNYENLKRATRKLVRFERNA